MADNSMMGNVTQVEQYGKSHLLVSVRFSRETYLLQA